MSQSLHMLRSHKADRPPSWRAAHAEESAQDGHKQHGSLPRTTSSAGEPSQAAKPRSRTRAAAGLQGSAKPREQGHQGEKCMSWVVIAAPGWSPRPQLSHA